MTINLTGKIIKEVKDWGTILGIISIFIFIGYGIYLLSMSIEKREKEIAKCEYQLFKQDYQPYEAEKLCLNVEFRKNETNNK